MRFHLVFVGKTGFRDLESAIGRYLERLQHYHSVQVHYTKAEKISAAADENVVRARESERVMKLAGKSGHLIVWDRGGREMDSPGLARFVEKLVDSGIGETWMVIGGPAGVSPELLKSANTVLSLSRLTFPHDLARLMVVEQLYRVFSITRGEPYHR